MRIRYSLLLIFLFISTATLPGQQEKAVRGVLDLRKMENKDRFIVTLNGEWAFYWKQMLYPNDFKKGTEREGQYFVHVPSYWTDYKDVIKTEKTGYATYHLLILLPKGINKRLSLDVPVFDSSFDLWINDSLIYSNGQPGKSEESTIPGYRPGFMRYTPDSDTLSILINVSNYHHRRGGFWLPMSIGTFQQVQKSKAAKYARDFSSVSLLAGFGLFFLIFFLLSPKDRILGFFSLALFGIAARPLFTSGYLIYDLAEISWLWTIRFEYISLYMIIAGWTWFADKLYPSGFIRIFSAGVSAYLLAVLTLTLFTPVKIFSYTVPLCQIAMIILIAYLTCKNIQLHCPSVPDRHDNPHSLLNL
jgi:hypothetical protein